jgi:dihydrofolate synthase / folylpolyglutamate synthase
MIPPSPAPVEQEILDFFASRNFERSRRFSAGAYDPAHLKAVLHAMANPQYEYETIHVAGTVGKGSATTYLQRGLTAMGKKAGSYLSPHFVSLRERMQIDGQYISADALASAWRSIRHGSALESLSFFDAMTAMAFVWFFAVKCDWAVVETGLGGRLDSTNNMQAKLAVITPIGLDHQSILGHSLELIATEKAGIIQQGQTVYSAPQNGNALEIIAAACRKVDAKLHIVEPAGQTYQEKNRDFARKILNDFFDPTTSQQIAIESSLAEPIFGRWTQLSARRIFYDAAHNLAGIEALCTLINQQPEGHCNIFLNTMKERDLSAFCEVLRNRLEIDFSLRLFPMREGQYYSAAETAAFLPVVTDAEITGILGDQSALHIFTGSMNIYNELRTRFAL